MPSRFERIVTGYTGTNDWITTQAKWQARKKELDFVHEKQGRDANLTYGASDFMKLGKDSNNTTS